MILAGDVGGTKCNLALFEIRLDSVCCVARGRFQSKDYSDFDKVVREFLHQAADKIAAQDGRIDAAAFGIAGPVVDQRVRATNLPWVVDAAILEREFPIGHVVLLNDLEASGHGLQLLRPEELLTLNPGLPAPGATCALIAAGTGLGEAIVFWDGTRHHVLTTEGGHCDFAPRNDVEIELLRFLKRRHTFTDFELILSGRGFRTLHEFLAPQMKHPSFDTLGADPAAEITELGLAGKCQHCVRSLEMFVSIYGAEAGNLALKAFARGGVYVAGGIAVRILDKMKDGTFVRAFRDKGGFGTLLGQIPIYVVLNEALPLLGAVARAAQVSDEVLAHWRFKHCPPTASS